jgi:hypothetical protein
MRGGMQGREGDPVRKLAFCLAALSLATIAALCVVVFRYCIPHSLPARTVASLNGQLAIDHDYLTGTIYNGSHWKVSKVVVRLTVYPSSPSEVNFGWTETSTPCSQSEQPLPPNTHASQVRDYSLRTKIAPLSVGEFNEKAGLILAQGDNWDCQIIAAIGVR